MKKTIIVVLVLVVLGVGAYFLFWKPSAPASPMPQAPVLNGNQPQNNQPTTQTPPQDKTKTVIGKSADGQDIVAYHYGSGGKEVLFVGGIHGGYEWNTVLLAYGVMDYLKAHPETIPQNAMVTVVPVLNPDGLSKVVSNISSFSASDVSTSQAVQISGRFNGNNVDLSRNFDCDWQANGVWQTTPVSGGSAPFSEPESQAIKNYVAAHNPAAVVVWYSAAGGVFSSSCHNGIPAETKTITTLYANAAGYPAYQSFDFYKVTGDMVNWLAKENIPGISVLLSTHTDVEFDKNISGVKALLQHYAN